MTELADSTMTLLSGLPWDQIVAKAILFGAGAIASALGHYFILGRDVSFIKGQVTQFVNNTATVERLDRDQAVLKLKVQTVEEAINGRSELAATARAPRR